MRALVALHKIYFQVCCGRVTQLRGQDRRIIHPFAGRCMYMRIGVHWGCALGRLSVKALLSLSSILHESVEERVDRSINGVDDVSKEGGVGSIVIYY
jgi:hypothetical protein